MTNKRKNMKHNMTPAAYQIINNMTPAAYQTITSCRPIKRTIIENS